MQSATSTKSSRQKRRKFVRLLIDGDILAYMEAAVAQKEIRWEEDDRTILQTRTVEETVESALHGIDALAARFGSKEVIVCLSVPTEQGWRREILPTYKAHRDPAAKPLQLAATKEAISRLCNVATLPRLEADDVLGILATDPRAAPTLIVSDDKDLLQIPGWVHRPRRDTLQRVTPAEGDAWHLWQAVVGDATDGYTGAPGVGPAKAARFFEQHGQTWDAVVAAFQSRKKTEEDALLQARVARILRHGEYDHEQRKEILWNPPR